MRLKSVAFILKLRSDPSVVQRLLNDPPHKDVFGEDGGVATGDN